jgi:hypothetical protein
MTSQLNGLCLLLICAAVSAGCAGMSVRPVGQTAQDTDAAARGIRFYQQAPFLFVYPDGIGGITAEVKWLPDTTQLFSARPYAFLANNETTLEFENSALSKAKLVVDDTAVVTASLEALGKVLAIAKDSEDVTEGQIPAPKLYRIIVNGDHVRLSDTETVGADGKPIVIKITLPRN